MLSRRASINVTYQGVDITEELDKDLISFTYTDNASGNADDISITLKDEKGKWLRDWKPGKGDILKSQINTFNWRRNGDKQILPCGTFIVDEPTYSGRPRILTLKAISIPSNSNFTTTKRSRAWENIYFKVIAQDIANRYGMKLFFDSKRNPYFDRVEQNDAPDISFLADLCESKGLSCKITDQSIVIFDEEEYEKKTAVATFYESSSTVLGYDLKTTLTNTAYAGCKVIYFDSALGKNIEYMFAVKDDIDPEKDKIYTLNSRVKSGQEAKETAMKKLRELNKKEYPVTLRVVGNIDLLGGNCVELKEFGAFDGKYFIDIASHTLPGYEVEMQLHRVLEGY